MFSIPTAIFTEAFLSFVGVGIMLPECSVGYNVGQNHLIEGTHSVFATDEELARWTKEK